MNHHDAFYVQLPPELIEAICEIAANVHDLSTAAMLARVCRRLRVR